MKKALFISIVIGLLFGFVPSYTPVTLPRTTLYAWYDFSGLDSNTTNAYGVVQSDGDISEISDISGNGRDYTQGTDANRPGLEIGTNGQYGAHFDGGDWLVNTTDADWVFLHSTQFTIIAVVRFGDGSNPNAQYAILGNSGNTSASIGMDFLFDDLTASSRNNAINFAAFKGDAVSAINNTAVFNERITPNVYGIVSANGDWTNSALCLSVYGADADWSGGGSTLRTTPSGSNATYDIQIGAGGNNTTPCTNTIIHEIAIWSSQLSGKDMAQALYYFSLKYDLQ